jgi:hypothetical protein
MKQALSITQGEEGKKSALGCLKPALLFLETTVWFSKTDV